MSRFWLRIASVGLALIFGFALVVASQGHATSPELRARHIDAGLRCPVCQGLSVADSRSSTSLAIASDVKRRVLAGQTDAQIRDYYVTRYGRWILLSPGGGLGAVAWALPIVALGAAVLAVALALRRWSRRPANQPTEADRLLVQQRRQQQTVGTSGSAG
jgi:cytochrome c-type biogenesis protein CcmH